MSLNFILLTHGRGFLMPRTHHEACSFIGVYNQTHGRYRGLYAPAGRNGWGGKAIIMSNPPTVEMRFLWLS